MKTMALALSAATALGLFGATAAAQRSNIRNPPQPHMMMRSARPIPIDGHFTFALDRGCQYTADVRGTARPAGNSPSGEALFNASGNVTSSVVCPGRSAIRGSENLANREPASMSAIEHVIEQRASLTTDTQGQHCSYVPNFTLTARRLEGVGASLQCPAPSWDTLRGGGPTTQK
jgi:hypothetical protein